MTLASSGVLTATQIQTELGLASFSMNRAQERALAGRPSGSYSWEDFYGQTSGGSCALTDASSIVSTISGVATHPSIAFGATAWNRKIICLVWWACETSAVETSVSTASIGGVTASIRRSYGEGGSSVSTNYGCAIIEAVVPTGASGTVLLGFTNATVRRTYLRTYRATGAVVSTTAAAFKEHLSAPSAASASAAITKPANCLLLTAASYTSFGTVGNMSASGNSEESETADATFDLRYLACKNTGLAAGATTITISGTASDAGRVRFVSAAYALT